MLGVDVLGCTKSPACLPKRARESICLVSLFVFTYSTVHVCFAAEWKTRKQQCYELPWKEREKSRERQRRADKERTNWSIDFDNWTWNTEWRHRINHAICCRRWRWRLLVLLVVVACQWQVCSVSLRVNMAICSVRFWSAETVCHRKKYGLLCLSPSYANLRVAIGADGTV